MESDDRPGQTRMPPPIVAPTRAPAQAPAMAPTMAPTMAPMKAPTQAPARVLPSTSAPLRAPGAPPPSTLPANGNIGDVLAPLPTEPAAPQPVLTSERNVATWPSTPGYLSFQAWLKQRCAKIKGQPIRRGTEGVQSECVLKLMDMLDALMSWIEEAPPQPQSSQRFGNLAFRTYISLVEQRLPPMLDWMNERLRGQVLPLLIQSHAFGHKTRLDYGTGHELAFVCALYCIGLSLAMSNDPDMDAIADDLVLRVFPRYLDLTTQLQATYRLEPAGSHGVWGLDDYVFLPYYFGSAQVLGSDLTPAQALKDATRPGSKPEDFEDMYSLALHRVGYFKKGAKFSEHSPLLYSLSQFPNWVKVHAGLGKMFAAEVLGKRVVVQGLWVGGWLWGNPLPHVEREEADKPKSPFTAAPSVATPFPASSAPGRTTRPR